MRNETRKEIEGQVLSWGCGQGFPCQVNALHFSWVAKGEVLMGPKEGSSVSYGSGCNVADRAGLGTGRPFRKLL